MSHDIVADVDRDDSTAYCWSLLGDGDDQACITICSTMAVCDWCILILIVVVCKQKILGPIVLAPVVQRVDNFTQWLNRYPAEQ